jgi:hypothetical protein
MKKYILIAFLLLSVIGYTQNGINYKALIKDSNGNILSSTPVNIQFIIYEGAALIDNIYHESHDLNTDQNGLVVANIGEGIPFSGTFNDINWNADRHFLNVQINAGSGSVDLGTTEFKSVPYAKVAENVSGLEAIDEGSGVAWRLIGRNPDNYGNIGGGAIDLSSAIDNAQDYGATGTGSFAIGFQTIASNATSTAMGFNTIASGIRSTAMGLRSHASGGNSIAMGEDTTASNLNSTAMGVDTTASGENSTAMGSNTTASGENSTAMGRSTDAIGENSVAMGGFTEALGDFSFAFGNGSEATGNHAIAMGDDSFASSDYAVALGRDAIASGINSFATGDNTVASGDYSTAMGSGADASGTYATAIGNGTEASGRLSTAMGFSTIASAYISTAFGRYNISGGSPTFWIGTDPLFEIGNGTSSTLSNALTVLKNGNVGIGTHTPQELLHLSGGRLRIGTETIEDTGSNRLSFNADLLPDSDNSFRLGNSATRWTSVWAADGTINTSDRRNKTNIKTIKYGLNEVLKMNPVSFNWKNRKDQNTKLGLIAQDLLKLIPEVVKTHDWQTTSDAKNAPLKKVELDRLGVYYSDLIPVLINAIKEQQETIETLKSRMEVVENN